MKAWITQEPIGADSVLPLVDSAEHGASLVFLGTVRNHNDGRAVTGVCYEAYQEMAQAQLAEIANEAAARFAPVSVAVVHRVGELKIGEVSVAIAVSSTHRADAFDAARYVIEQVKQRLPVWKHEHYASGTAQWLEGARPPVPEEAHG